MRKWIGILVVAAFVITTGFPTLSQAMVPHDAAKLEKAESSGHGDCHKHAAQGEKCCDKGICKCMDGACHNGLSKIFGNGESSLFELTASTNSFTFTNDVFEPALSHRLKRPPKA